MYECMDCGEEFEIPMQILDPGGPSPGDGPVDKIGACPECGSADIEEFDPDEDEDDVVEGLGHDDYDDEEDE
jgi:hypothetical protein